MINIKKKTIFILFSVLITFNSFSQFNSSEIFQFEIGAIDAQLQIWLDAEGYAGLVSPNLVIGATLPMINDVLNNRIVTIENGNLNYINYSENLPQGQVTVIDNGFIFDSNRGSTQKELYGINYEGNVIFRFQYWNSESVVLNDPNFRSIEFFYLNDTLFLYDSEHRLWSIEEPGPDSDENWNNLQDQVTTIENISMKSEQYSKLTVDLEGNLFLDGNYLSSNWDRYINYWSNRNIDQLPPTELSKDFPTHGYWDQRSNAFYYYAGTDIFGNVYWLRSLRTMLVFNNQGWLVSKISLDRDKLLFDSILPVVSLLSGEVFYLEHFQMNNQDIVR